MTQNNIIPIPVKASVSPCQCHTHTSLAIIDMLKYLPLASILQKNKWIEAENYARALNSLKHATDPVAYPVAGYETASLVTINAEDLNCLRVPLFLSSFHEWIYPGLAKSLRMKSLRIRKRRLNERCHLRTDNHWTTLDFWRGVAWTGIHMSRGLLGHTCLSNLLIASSTPNFMLPFPFLSSSTKNCTSWSTKCLLCLP